MAIFEINLSNVLKSEYDSIGTKIVENPRRFGIAETDGKFITKLINAVFVADAVKEVITKEMRKKDSQLVEELGSLGVII